jgi:hypothetical protein
MSIELKAYDNGDHVCLVWLPDGERPIPDCRGFAIERTRNGQSEYLHGYVGFSDQDKLDPNNPWKFPLQRLMWWDYKVTPGDNVQYRVVPVTGKDKDHLELKEDLASTLTPVMNITGQFTAHISAYFNKGIVASQWVSHALDQAPKNASIKALVQTEGNPLRNALSGLLRPEILSLMDDAKKQGRKIFAALYELNDPELIAALVTFGKDCNLILANDWDTTFWLDAARLARVLPASVRLVCATSGFTALNYDVRGLARFGMAPRDIALPTVVASQSYSPSPARAPRRPTA